MLAAVGGRVGDYVGEVGVGGLGVEGGLGILGGGVVMIGADISVACSVVLLEIERFGRVLV